ncbi:E3 ubiquitin-protein ligase RNF217 [Octopus bimaculoides]|uniref:RBR-type E3 ubiquitin transferase n=1 Tax=Octopus bimaculoides TaxID=37653 RepID=A0A0L8I2C9_OCTBM|nr:E3 ubiquitin-protein ligase RNF217 [Octopus bimaculoides]|eukprot:XP_014767482.1 PREDICTED: probable E3 ubiquitin-protein ligase RNF217 [Octopus bimaculoides]
MASGITEEQQAILNDLYLRQLNLPDALTLDNIIENFSMLNLTSLSDVCKVCYSNSTSVHYRPCCNFLVCSSCLTRYLSEKVQLGIVNIKCLNICECYINQDDIMAYLPSSLKEKFNKFLVDANKDPCVKTCPNCCSIISIDKSQMKHKKCKKGLKVVCSTCSTAICFPCQAQWHEGITCKQFQKGDKMVSIWAKNYQNGQLNAQQCPKCKIFIQRSTGCDQMSCKKCDTNFCYLCGDKFRGIKFFGDHFSKLSVFGCKYHFLPQKNITRKLIRGTLFGGKLLASIMLGSLAVGVGGALVGLGTVFLPVYGSVCLYRRLKYQKKVLNKYRINCPMELREVDFDFAQMDALSVTNPHLFQDSNNSFDDLQLYFARPHKLILDENIDFIHNYPSKQTDNSSDIKPEGIYSLPSTLFQLEEDSDLGHSSMLSVCHSCESIASNSNTCLHSDSDEDSIFSALSSSVLDLQTNI